MGDLIQLFNELKGPFGGAGAVGIAVAVYFWSQKGQRQLDGANTEANVSAIAHWKDVAERSDKALVAMTERADMFAEQRNEAYKQLARMEGQLAQMNLQLEAQNRKLETQSQEMQGLRTQITNLQEQLNAQR